MKGILRRKSYKNSKRGAKLDDGTGNDSFLSQEMLAQSLSNIQQAADSQRQGNRRSATPSEQRVGFPTLGYKGFGGTTLATDANNGSVASGGGFSSMVPPSQEVGSCSDLFGNSDRDDGARRKSLLDMESFFAKENGMLAHSNTRSSTASRFLDSSLSGDGTEAVAAPKPNLSTSTCSTLPKPRPTLPARTKSMPSATANRFLVAHREGRAQDSTGISARRSSIAQNAVPPEMQESFADSDGFAAAAADASSKESETSIPFPNSTVSNDATAAGAGVIDSNFAGFSGETPRIVQRRLARSKSMSTSVAATIARAATKLDSRVDETTNERKVLAVETKPASVDDWIGDGFEPSRPKKSGAATVSNDGFPANAFDDNAFAAAAAAAAAANPSRSFHKRRTATSSSNCRRAGTGGTRRRFSNMSGAASVSSGLEIFRERSSTQVTSSGQPEFSSPVKKKSKVRKVYAGSIEEMKELGFNVTKAASKERATVAMGAFKHRSGHGKERSTSAGRPSFTSAAKSLPGGFDSEDEDGGIWSEDDFDPAFVGAARKKAPLQSLQQSLSELDTSMTSSPKKVTSDATSVSSGTSRGSRLSKTKMEMGPGSPVRRTRRHSQKWKEMQVDEELEKDSGDEDETASQSTRKTMTSTLSSEEKDPAVADGEVVASKDEAIAKSPTNFHGDNKSQSSCQSKSKSDRERDDESSTKLADNPGDGASASSDEDEIVEKRVKEVVPQSEPEEKPPGNLEPEPESHLKMKPEPSLSEPLPELSSEPQPIPASPKPPVRGVALTASRGPSAMGVTYIGDIDETDDELESSSTPFPSYVVPSPEPVRKKLEYNCVDITEDGDSDEEDFPLRPIAPRRGVRPTSTKRPAQSSSVTTAQPTPVSTQKVDDCPAAKAEKANGSTRTKPSSPRNSTTKPFTAESDSDSSYSLKLTPSKPMAASPSKKLEDSDSGSDSSASRYRPREVTKRAVPIVTPAANAATRKNATSNSDNDSSRNGGKTPNAATKKGAVLDSDDDRSEDGDKTSAQRVSCSSSFHNTSGPVAAESSAKSALPPPSPLKKSFLDDSDSDRSDSSVSRRILRPSAVAPEAEPVPADANSDDEGDSESMHQNGNIKVVDSDDESNVSRKKSAKERKKDKKHKHRDDPKRFDSPRRKSKKHDGRSIASKESRCESPRRARKQNDQSIAESVEKSVNSPRRKSKSDKSVSDNRSESPGRKMKKDKKKKKKKDSKKSKKKSNKEKKAKEKVAAAAAAAESDSDGDEPSNSNSSDEDSD